MNSINDTANFFNDSFGQALPAVSFEPDNGAMWDNFLIEAAGELEQSRLQQNLLPMTPTLPMPPTATLEGLGIHVPAVQELIVADGGFAAIPFPRAHRCASGSASNAAPKLGDWARAECVPCVLKRVFKTVLVNHTHAEPHRRKALQM
ncbi:hypothetical protein GGH20_000948 [Coemansia sp. RSA 1937]|nr:hypothetical protein GGH20_000948 [Coemansia sp. RSA 1937]